MRYLNVPYTSWLHAVHFVAAYAQLRTGTPSHGSLHRLGSSARLAADGAGARSAGDLDRGLLSRFGMEAPSRDPHSMAAAAWAPAGAALLARGRRHAGPRPGRPGAVLAMVLAFAPIVLVLGDHVQATAALATPNVVRTNEVCNLLLALAQRAGPFKPILQRLGKDLEEAVYDSPGTKGRVPYFYLYNHMRGEHDALKQASKRMEGSLDSALQAVEPTPQPTPF